MNRTKKLASILLALVMAIAMAVPAFATSGTNDNNGKITIDNAIVGQTYSVYQLLQLESYDTAKDAYSYKATENWEEFFNSAEIKGVYVNVDAQGYVTWTGSTDRAEEFAKKALAWANAQDPAVTPDKDPVKATSNKVEFTGLNLGYYLVDSSAGALCSLDTTDKEVTIHEKNTHTPTVDKTVDGAAVNSADIGDTVNFEITVHAKKGAADYILHDKMSAGLTLNAESVTVAGAVEGTDYTVVTTGLTDECDFEIHFESAYLDGLTYDDEFNCDIVVTYSAVVNANAEIAGNGNSNETHLEYGDKITTQTGSTTTYVWSFDVLKYGNGDETKVLQGASFVVLNSEGKVATFADGKFSAWADAPTGNAPWNTASVLTTDRNGKIEVIGLDAGTYQLRETQAPNGYNKLTKDVEVEIVPTTSNDGKTMSLTPVTAKVNNQAGTELPETGGIGTTIFYTLGGIMAAGAVILLVTKKRMSSK